MQCRELSILIRAHNDEADIGDTVSAILAQQCPLPFTVYCCDDNSSDRTGRIIRSFPEVRVIERPPGDYLPGRTLNHMVRQCAGQIVVFNNADAVPQDRHWLSSLIAPLLTDEADAAYANQLPRPNARWLVRKDHERAFGDGRVSAKWRFFFSLASAAARREDLLSNPFDETFRYSEDIEWARRRPIRIKYVPAARVCHSHDYTARQLRKRFYGEGYAEARICGAAPGLCRTMISVVAESARDLLYILRHPAGWRELPGAPRRRWIQRFAARRGALDCLHEVSRHP